MPALPCRALLDTLTEQQPVWLLVAHMVGVKLILTCLLVLCRILAYNKSTRRIHGAGG